jgi:DNA-binding NarL/FixJ family response regulator
MGDDITVVVVDDEPLVRMGVRAVLDRQPGIAVVAEAANGLEAIQVCGVARPDVVLMDLRMPVMGGIEATARLLGSPHAVKVVVLTTFDVDEQVYAALRAGASGFLTKDSAPEQVADAVRAAAAGDSLLSPRITRRLIETFTRLPPPGAATPEVLSALTSRELEVLTAIARGRSNARIAADLFLSEATVKSHVSRVFAKLGVADRAQAVIAAYETGLVRPGDMTTRPDTRAD